MAQKKEMAQQLNDVVDYLESHITEKIDYDALAAIAGCSVYNLQRLFSYIMDVSIADYVRYRRMTLAAEELQRSKVRIIDLALRYGYESPEAFTRAFQAFHHVSPTSMRKMGIAYERYPRVSYQMMIRGGIPEKMETVNEPEIVVRLEERESFWVLGIENKKSERIFDPDCPACWNEFFQTKADKLIEPFRKEAGYLGVFCDSEPGYWNYLIGGVVEADAGFAVPKGLMLRQFPASAFSVITHTPLPSREEANRQIGRLVGYAHGMGWECPEGYERYFSPIMFMEAYPPEEEDGYRVEIWLPIRKVEPPQAYNALERYAAMRREVVSDLPQDFTLEGLGLAKAEKESITAGLPLVRDCILGIYDSVRHYAQTTFDEEKTSAILTEKGGMMKLNREAQKHLDTTFAALLCILQYGVYDAETASFTMEKKDLQDMPRRLEKRYGIKPVYLEHVAHFCRVEYWQGKSLSDWRHADTVRLVFEDFPLAYTLRFMVGHGVTLRHFPYGDFRLFSAAGQKEDKSRFPQSLYRKALGEERYRLFCRLKEKMDAVLGDLVCFEKENWYQGDGRFRLIEHHALHTKNFGYVEYIIYKDQLQAALHFDKAYFEHLPGIMENLSTKFRDIVFHLPQCLEKAPCGAQCKELCKGCRTAVFDARLYPEEVMHICHHTNIVADISDDEDIESMGLLYRHFLDYMAV